MLTRLALGGPLGGGQLLVVNPSGDDLSANAYLALKLLTNDVRTATVRAKGGFKRLGATVLHQVSFSMRAARVESDPTAVASASPDHPRDDDFDPLATS